MNRRLKTVPLRELLGDPRAHPRGLRLACVALAIAELALGSVILWKVMH